METINDTVAKNIETRLAKMGKTANWLQQQVSPTSSGVFDFLSKKRAARSMKVETLALIAEKLDMPIGSFLLPPDRAAASTHILRILHSNEPLRSEAVGKLVQGLVDLASLPRSEGPAKSDSREGS